MIRVEGTWELGARGQGASILCAREEAVRSSEAKSTSKPAAAAAAAAASRRPELLTVSLLREIPSTAITASTRADCTCCVWQPGGLHLHATKLGAQSSQTVPCRHACSTDACCATVPHFIERLGASIHSASIPSLRCSSCGAASACRHRRASRTP